MPYGYGIGGGLMETKLKPCPFCGRKAELVRMEYGSGSVYFGITCENWRCAVASVVPNFSYEEEAIEAWNRRAEDGT